MGHEDCLAANSRSTAPQQRNTDDHLLQWGLACIIMLMIYERIEWMSGWWRSIERCRWRYCEMKINVYVERSYFNSRQEAFIKEFTGVIFTLL